MAIWSNHGTIFVGAARELKDLYTHLRNPQTEFGIEEFCGDQGMQWSFAPEHVPHLGGLWKAAVKSQKCHFWRMFGNVCVTLEELATILAQMEACLNFRPYSFTPTGR